MSSPRNSGSPSAWEAYRAIFASQTLDKHEKLVMAALVSQLPPTDLTVERFASSSRLANMTGLSRTIVKETMTSLKDKRCIATRPDFDGKGGKRANVYRILPTLFADFTADTGASDAAAPRPWGRSPRDHGVGRPATTNELNRNNKEINTNSSSVREEEQGSVDDPRIKELLDKAAKAFGRPIGVGERLRFAENMQISGFSIKEAETELIFLANHPSGRRHTFSVNRIFDPGPVRAECERMDKNVGSIVREGGADDEERRKLIRELAHSQADRFDLAVFENYYVSKFIGSIEANAATH